MNQNNILGIFADDSGADCVVCMCEIRDTIILPCRHLCLCYTCAESLRFQVIREDLNHKKKFETLFIFQDI